MHVPRGAGQGEQLSIGRESHRAGQITIYGALDTMGGAPIARMPETVFRPRAAHQPPSIRTEAYVWHCLSRQFGFLFASGRIPDFDIWIVPPTGGHPLAVRTDGNEFHPRLGASQCLQRPASHIENVATIFVSKS